MDKPATLRRQIGLIFLSTYQKWSGGIIYIINIVSALNLADDDQKPEIVLIHTDEAPIEDILSIGYPYLTLQRIDLNLTLPQRIKNKIVRILTKKTVFLDKLPDVVYPYNHGITYGKREFFWIPDFQERYLPHMFSKDDIDARVKTHLFIAQSKGTVIFSSKNAMSDFKKFYPVHSCTLKLLRFACSLPDFSHENIEALKDKFAISKPYFMSPNQFWKHKNHFVVLEAILKLKNKGLVFEVVFTGSENDFRNKDYFLTLKEFIVSNSLQPWVKMLGFIDRTEQLALMDNAISIIQPSFFEGWSTVVEDAKALSQVIVLSNIAVHEEQITENCHFFDPNNSDELASIMEEMLNSRPIRLKQDYMVSVRAFSSSILEVLQ
ncbi:glycosyltransferase family 1 protein [Dyadobacter sp. CY326]|uniref:glycosyltransferase family 4 protein n=1 Tax=Dyadobacter sp. CY326 TaxID=2907300 RepID=UPI001F3E8E58|nr:glycosyltransferase family 1 protein [Dyadobacter sp. CY326]MCE7065378.1 glycosyltransferase family 4 protein [Dyadobacter sp. CY326]